MGGPAPESVADGTAAPVVGPTTSTGTVPMIPEQCAMWGGASTTNREGVAVSLPELPDRGPACATRSYCLISAADRSPACLQLADMRGQPLGVTRYRWPIYPQSMTGYRAAAVATNLSGPRKWAPIAVYTGDSVVHVRSLMNVSYCIVHIEMSGSAS
jgi:hypothetical protein